MKKILVVDDELPIRKLLYEALTGKGYQVSSASSGEKAIVLLKKQRPDLIILDIGMPGMSGIETLREIRSIDNKVDVVMMSGVATDEMEREAREIGVSDFLFKGLAVDRFIKVVAKLLDGKGADA